jgi:hypothetical protein
MSLPVNFALFMLAGSFRLAACVGFITALEWWYLSDYYMLRFGPWWTEWLDRYAFVLASFGSLLVLAGIGSLYLRCRYAKRSAGRGLPLFDGSLRVATWREMLQVATQEETGVSRRFLHWQATRLAHVRPEALIDESHVARAWWFRGPWAVPVLLTSCWLPLLWTGLILVPLRTNVMEWAAAAGGTPQRVYAVVCTGRVAKTERDAKTGRVVRTGDPVNEQLLFTPPGFIRTGHSAFVSDGTFELAITVSQRTYRRRLAVRCGDRCRIAANVSSPYVLDLTQDVMRSGTTSFGYQQADSNHPQLGITLKLVRHDGKVLSTVMIDP